MTIFTAILGVAFAAFCVWLTLRIVNRREKWAKRTGVVLIVILFGYPLSYGPLIWLDNQHLVPEWTAPILFRLYSPIHFLYLNGPEPIRSVLQWYCRIFGA